MTATRLAGFILIAVGLAGLLWGGITWTRDKTVVDVGPIKATTETRESIPIPPLAGGIALVAGIALLVIPGRRR